MAKHNRFSEKGMKPTFDLYQIPLEDVQKECESILKEEYGLSNEVYITQEEEGDAFAVRIEIENAEDIEEDHWKVHERMINEGFNPEDDSDVVNSLCFKLGGGQDAWLEWGPLREDVQYLNFFINPRQDVEIKILEVMEVALEGSRDDTVKALNNMKKEVCLR